MRCGCPQCETFMVHEEDRQSACVCPQCGYKCNACLGTGTALTREEALARFSHSDYQPGSLFPREDQNDRQG